MKLIERLLLDRVICQGTWLAINNGIQFALEIPSACRYPMLSIRDDSTMWAYLASYLQALASIFALLYLRIISTFLHVS